MRALILAVMFCAADLYSAAGPVEQWGRLQVKGVQLCSDQGDPVQLRGVSSHGLQWFGQFMTDKALDFACSGMGADLFRIAMYVEEGGYVTNPAGFTARVNKLVDMCEKRGIYCIIDWHILADGDPNKNISHARTFWKAMAKAHAGKKHVLYEICNEPNGSGATWDRIKTYADDIIGNCIKPYDPATVVIVGTPNWSSQLGPVTQNPLQFTNVMYTFHFYAGTHTDTAPLAQYLNKIPVFCTEWGPTDADGDGGENYGVADKYMELMAGKNSSGQLVSWASWSYCDDFRSSSHLKKGSCAAGLYDLSRLTAAGNYTMDQIQSGVSPSPPPGPIPDPAPNPPDPSPVPDNPPFPWPFPWSFPWFAVRP
ncbi:MAG: glycoside hydrolase family 5 protein [Candidatus Wallbacteria bacterium]|nr:glycoside hydrolase family 5 protein [Candidatus Wallbacteria bacterium]